MSTETTDRIAEIAEEYGLNEEAFVGFCDNQHITADEAEDAVSDFEDAYVGEFSNEAEFAENYADEMGDHIPDYIRGAVDWSDVWEMTLRHDYYEVNGHYFRNI